MSFSRAYLRHLVMAREILGFHLLTVHNLFSLERLMFRLRAAILSGGVSSLLEDMRRSAAPNDKGNSIDYDS